MAKAKPTGRDGIDRWTSNGYGIVTGNSKPAAPKPQTPKPQPPKPNNAKKR